MASGVRNNPRCSQCRIPARHTQILAVFKVLCPCASQCLPLLLAFGGNNAVSSSIMQPSLLHAAPKDAPRHTCGAGRVWGEPSVRTLSVLSLGVSAEVVRRAWRRIRRGRRGNGAQQLLVASEGGHIQPIAPPRKRRWLHAGDMAQVVCRSVARFERRCHHLLSRHDHGHGRIVIAKKHRRQP